MKAPHRDHRLVRILLATCALLVLGFGAAWAYLAYSERQQLSSAYTSLKPVAISHSGHSMAATIAIKTSGSDARWAAQHRLGLEGALQETLLGVDPKRALAPGGLRELQQTLQAQLNARLQTDKVQEVLITDFLVSEGDF